MKHSRLYALGRDDNRRSERSPRIILNFLRRKAPGPLITAITYIGPLRGPALYISVLYGITAAPAGRRRLGRTPLLGARGMVVAYRSD